VIEAAIKSGEAWAAVGGLTIESHMLDKSFQFSWPVMHSGLRITTVGKEDNEYWKWLDSFTADLWAAILVTAFFVGLLVKVLEHPYFPKKTDFKGKYGFTEGVWHAFASVTYMSDR
jgi:hypothetical protein